ncbi:MAG: MerR family transcriptional regulator [Bacteroidales bacterium]|nr:MerR family transcriptional regulator [Bacteroidales bacterium]
MKEKIKLKIGEFSKLNQITVKTLRYYEEIGLLIPSEIDDWSGYRYYNVDQMQRMNQIIYLKSLGFSLEEIKTMFDHQCYTPTTEMISEKIKKCRLDMNALKKREIELKSLHKQLKNKTNMENFTIKSLPAVIVASHRQIISSYQELFNLCPNVLGPEMARLGCECVEPGYCFTIDHNKEYREADIDIEYCEAVVAQKQDSELIQFKELPIVEQALCFQHYGPYQKFPESWAKIYAFLEENGYQIIDFPRFCYIDGIWNKEDENEWLTEIQVPIKK